MVEFVVQTNCFLLALLLTTLTRHFTLTNNRKKMLNKMLG